MMKAAYIERTGPAELIRYGDLPDPVPGKGEVLVKVAAVAVNPIDTYVRGGLVAATLPFPFVVGCDLAGTIVDLGPGVTRFKAGDRVWGSNQGLAGRQGTFAELAAVHESWLYPTPVGVDDQFAAALALTGITAHLGLFREARLRSSETLFVNGGTGGVGSVVLQMTKVAGGRVITTAGSDDKVEICRQAGADLAINYKTEDVDARIRDFCPAGVDIWWETLREPNFERTVPLLARRGRIIVMAGRDAHPVLPVGPLYTRDGSIRGFAMFNATPEEQRLASVDINRWLADGKLRPNIGRVFPLREAAAAHKLQEDNTIGKAATLTGKIVLVP